MRKSIASSPRICLPLSPFLPSSHSLSLSLSYCISIFLSLSTSYVTFTFMWKYRHLSNHWFYADSVVLSLSWLPSEERPCFIHRLGRNLIWESSFKEQSNGNATPISRKKNTCFRLLESARLVWITWHGGSEWKKWAKCLALK